MNCYLSVFLACWFSCSRTSRPRHVNQNETEAVCSEISYCGNLFLAPEGCQAGQLCTYTYSDVLIDTHTHSAILWNDQCGIRTKYNICESKASALTNRPSMGLYIFVCIVQAYVLLIDEICVRQNSAPHRKVKFRHCCLSATISVLREREE